MIAFIKRNRNLVEEERKKTRKKCLSLKYLKIVFKTAINKGKKIIK